MAETNESSDLRTQISAAVQEPTDTPEAVLDAALKELTPEEPDVPLPEAWKSEERQKLWEQIPKEARKALHARESEVHKGFTKHDEERAFARKIKETLTPYMPVIQSLGIPPEQAISSLLNTEYTLRTAPPMQKAQVLMSLAQQYGVDLSQIGQMPQIDPNTAYMQQQLHALQRQQMIERQQAQTQAMAEIQTEIETFGEGKQDFDILREDMAALLQSGRAKSLEDAYNQAQWLNPVTRSNRIKAEQAAKLAEAKAKTEAARKAAGSISGGPGSAPAANATPSRSLRDELQAQFRAAKGARV